MTYTAHNVDDDAKTSYLLSILFGLIHDFKLQGMDLNLLTQPSASFHHQTFGGVRFLQSRGQVISSISLISAHHYCSKPLMAVQVQAWLLWGCRLNVLRLEVMEYQFRSSHTLLKNNYWSKGKMHDVQVCFSLSWSLVFSILHWSYFACLI